MKRRITQPFTTAAIATCLSIAGATDAAADSLSGFSLGGAATQQPAPASARSLDGIAAVVDDGVILKSQLAAQLAQARAQGNRDVPADVLRSRVLDRMIMQKLQLERAHQLGIRVTKRDLQQGMRRIARQNNMNLAQFRRAARQQGMGDDLIKRKVREQMLIAKLRRRQVMSKVAINDNDIKQYLETQNLQQGRSPQFKFRRIALAAGANADDTRDRLQAIRQRIDSGDDFANVAAQVSAGPNANDGGLVDWHKASALPLRISGALDSLSAGQVSPIVRHDNQLMLLQLVDRRYGGTDSKSGVVREIKAQHILLRANAIRDRQRTERQAQNVRQQLAAGADFSALARQYSDDDASADSGGNLGWIPLARVSPKTRSQLAKLNPGDVTPVLKTRQGYEIIKLNQRRQQDKSEQKRRDQARQALGRQRAGEQGRLWLRELRDDAYVDIRIDNYQPQPSR